MRSEELHEQDDRAKGSEVCQRRGRAGEMKFRRLGEDCDAAVGGDGNQGQRKLNMLVVVCTWCNLTHQRSSRLQIGAVTMGVVLVNAE